ncbi:MAG TPA: DUF2062 domain-containing protein [Burkholderiales bacterium]
MPRKFLRRILPGHESVRQHRHLARFGRWLHHPNLWHLNRDSVAGGVAAGLFAGLAPGTHAVKFLVAALLAIAFRVNLPVAVAVTLYVNPFTIGPLLLVAYEIGKLFFPGEYAAPNPAPAFDWSNLSAWTQALLAWILSLGKPLAVGLPTLAAGLAVAGYAFVRLAWRAHVILAWRRRRRRRAANDSR